MSAVCLLFYSSNPIQHDLNPAHEAYDETLGLISTTGLYQYTKDGKVKNRRIFYHVKKDENGKNERKTIAEIAYDDTDLAGCPKGVVGQSVRYINFSR